MSESAVIQRLLTQCEEYIAVLRAMRKVDLAGYERDKALQWQVERGLQLAAQACIDIGDELLFRMGEAEPETAPGIFLSLRSLGFLDPDLADSLAACVRFRNILVRARADLDAAEVFRHWSHDLACYERFCTRARDWLLGRGAPGSPTVP
ncbi:MAG: DUF86 domain-containing protein [Armatimonadetes bacterium]|nr:DUF86 domain-containing protein [Armatimonadota bacterium]